MGGSPSAAAAGATAAASLGLEGSYVRSVATSFARCFSVALRLRSSSTGAWPRLVLVTSMRPLTRAALDEIRCTVNPFDRDSSISFSVSSPLYVASRPVN